MTTRKFPSLEVQLMRAFEAEDIARIQELIEAGADLFSPVSVKELPNELASKLKDARFEKLPFDQEDFGEK